MTDSTWQTRCELDALSLNLNIITQTTEALLASYCLCSQLEVAKLKRLLPCTDCVWPNLPRRAWLLVKLSYYLLDCGRYVLTIIRIRNQGLTELALGQSFAFLSWCIQKASRSDWAKDSKADYTGAYTYILSVHQDVCLESSGRLKNALMFVDWGVVHQDYDVPPTCYLIGAQSVQSLEKEVFEDRCVNTSFNQLCGENSVICNGG